MSYTHRLSRVFVWRLAVALALLLSLPMVSAHAVVGNLAARPGAPSEARYDILVERDVPIPMRDGAIMVADIYRPKAEGRFPVLLENTSYDRRVSTDIRMSTHSFFVPRGYVLVVRSSRGRFGSEGAFDLYKAERNDGYDAVEWAALQPWSNGRVGLVGKSLAGQSLFHAAASRPPHLVCAMAALTGADLWREWYYRGGAMEFAFLAYWTAGILGQDMAERALDPEALQSWVDLQALYLADQAEYSSIVPISRFRPARISKSVNIFADLAAHPTDGPYWRAMSPNSFFGDIAVPVLHIGGWYDIFLNGAFRAFHELRKKGGSALARDNQRLLIGPWHHSVPSFYRPMIGVVDFGPNLADPNVNQLRLAFADYWLKDIRHDDFHENEPVRVFTMGANVWRTGEDWPFSDMRSQKYYLRVGPSGSIDSPNDGSLSLQPPDSAEEPQTYLYDPMDPTPTRGGSGLLLFPYGPRGLADYGPHDQTPVERASLTFTSPPLESDLEITGPVTVVLYAASSAVDTDWVARVSDVDFKGTSLNVVEGVQRARYRDSGENPRLATPGEIYRYDVDLWATSHVFKAGHRIRVTINSSSFPRWSRNMNVAEFPEQSTVWTVARNSIYLDAAHPSHVLLPVRKP
ncbi:putative peptidase [Alphaproteobacteria bacterium]|nr:putative peptidase [Alphaproteobacteria bacterium]